MVFSQCKFISKFNSGANLPALQEDTFKNVVLGKKYQTVQCKRITIQHFIGLTLFFSLYPLAYRPISSSKEMLKLKKIEIISFTSSTMMSWRGRGQRER